MLEHLYKQCNYSGIWIDMNEPTNFCNGECDWSRSMPDEDFIVESFKNDIFKLPYTPGETNLDKNTLATNIKHYNGFIHKDTHNLNGL
jgi:alpha-glucosidase/lysosomal alpha-glucosidase